MAEKKTYRKECEYCKIEYVAQSPLSKTCSDSCRKALSRARKSDSVTPSHSVTVTPEIEQPRVSETALAEVIATVVGQVIIEKLGSEFAGLGDIIGNKIKEAVKEVALMQVSPPMERTDIPKVPFSKPMELDTDELPVVEVKKSKAQGGSSQNFLNSIMALNG